MSSRDRPLVAVIGSSDWKHVELLARRLHRLPRDATLITTDGDGAPYLAHEYAKWASMDSGIFPIPWKVEGRKAARMAHDWLLDEKPDLTIVFANDIEEPGAIRSCALKAFDLGYSIEIWQPAKPTFRSNVPPLYYPQLTK